MNESSTTEATSKLPLLIMGGVACLAVLVMIALISLRNAPSFEPGTPEAAMQGFLDAAFDNDDEAMLSHIDPSLRAGCETRIDDHGSWRVDEELRASLASMDVSGDTAIAKIDFSRSSADPFDTSTYSFTEQFELARGSGEWFINGASWPYVLANCTRG